MTSKWDPRGFVLSNTTAALKYMVGIMPVLENSCLDFIHIQAMEEHIVKVDPAPFMRMRVAQTPEGIEISMGCMSDAGYVVCTSVAPVLVKGATHSLIAAGEPGAALVVVAWDTGAHQYTIVWRRATATFSRVTVSAGMKIGRMCDACCASTGTGAGITVLFIKERVIYIQNISIYTDPDKPSRASDAGVFLKSHIACDATFSPTSETLCVLGPDAFTLHQCQQTQTEGRLLTRPITALSEFGNLSKDMTCIWNTVSVSVTGNVWCFNGVRYTTEWTDPGPQPRPSEEGADPGGDESESEPEHAALAMPAAHTVYTPMVAMFCQPAVRGDATPAVIERRKKGAGSAWHDTWAVVPNTVPPTSRDLVFQHNISLKMQMRPTQMTRAAAPKKSKVASIPPPLQQRNRTSYRRDAMGGGLYS